MVRHLGIVGAGTMGTGIAQAAALSNIDVLLYDVNETILRRSLETIKADFKRLVEKRKLSPEKMSTSFARIHPRTHLADLHTSEIVIEAIIEDLRVKKDLFKHLDTHVRTSAVLASNTSSFSITAIASATKDPARVIGMHFFNPAQTMKLVEVIRGEQSSDESIQRGLELAQGMGKTAVVAKDRPGFIVNRIARPFYGEALRLLGENVATHEQIDRIVRQEGGFKMGPFELMDLIGIDVNLAVTESVFQQYYGEPRYRPHPIQRRMVDSGLLGKKTGKGFYVYQNVKK